MPLSEFKLIQRFFTKQAVHSAYTRVGIGDDAAILSVPAGYNFVTSVDVLNEGVHFPAKTSAYEIGHKALAVSLSDIAAMGAKPTTALLTLTLPQVEPLWLEQFAAGFFALATQHEVELIGGDVTRGPLSIATVVNGLVPQGQALLRKGAKPGDLIYVTGTLGDAGLALELLVQGSEKVAPGLLARLNSPSPRVSTGQAIRPLATSAMDISDGVLGDLAKLCGASKVGAEIESSKIPLSTLMKKFASHDQAIKLALTAGDDYELLFTAPREHESVLAALSLEVGITQIGQIKSAPGIVVKDKAGKLLSFPSTGYDHFKEQ